MKSDPNFYVQFGKYFGDSLKYIGNQKEVNIIVEEFLRDDKPIDVRIGGCLAVGIKYFGKGDINCINLLRPLLFFDDDFVKSSACLSLGFGFLGTCNETVVEILSCIIKEEISVDVRKSAILGLGLVNLGAGSEDFIRIIFPLLKDPNWRIRAVAGLSLSFGCMGHGEKLFDKLDH